MKEPEAVGGAFVFYYWEDIQVWRKAELQAAVGEVFGLVKDVQVSFNFVQVFTGGWSLSFGGGFGRGFVFIIVRQFRTGRGAK